MRNPLWNQRIMSSPRAHADADVADPEADDDRDDDEPNEEMKRMECPIQ